MAGIVESVSNCTHMTNPSVRSNRSHQVITHIPSTTQWGSPKDPQTPRSNHSPRAFQTIYMLAVQVGASHCPHRGAESLCGILKHIWYRKPCVPNCFIVGGQWSCLHVICLQVNMVWLTTKKACVLDSFIVLITDNGHSARSPSRSYCCRSALVIVWMVLTTNCLPVSGCICPHNWRLWTFP